MQKKTSFEEAIKQQNDAMIQKERKNKEAINIIKKLKEEIEKLKEDASVYKTEDLRKPKVDKEKLKEEIKQSQEQLSMEITNGKKEIEKYQMILLELKKEFKRLTSLNRVYSNKIAQKNRLSKSTRHEVKVIDNALENKAAKLMESKRMRLKKSNRYGKVSTTIGP